jgi:hypothetical protein
VVPELVGLTLAVIAINAWNRLSIPFRAEVGSDQPGTAEAAAAALASALIAYRGWAGATNARVQSHSVR